MQARLKVLHDKANVKQVKLLPVTLIGRSTDCNLKIASSQVSRNHCRITLGEDMVYVEDLGSANGTMVDGQLLPAHQPTAIAPGAHLVVGPAEFLIDYVASTSATMVLSRRGAPPVADLPSTEMILPPSEEIPPAAPAAPIIPAAVSASNVVHPLESQPAVTAASEATILVSPAPTISEVDPSTEESPGFDSEATISDFNFSAASNLDEATEAAPFAFADTPSSAAVSSESASSAETSSKKGGLKSLFSLFGRKDRPPSSNTSDRTPPTTTAGPSVFLPTVESQAVEVVAVPTLSPEDAIVGLSDGHVDETMETTELDGPAAPGTSTEDDDGFQQFLQQL